MLCTAINKTCQIMPFSGISKVSNMKLNISMKFLDDILSLKSKAPSFENLQDIVQKYIPNAKVKNIELEEKLKGYNGYVERFRNGNDLRNSSVAIYIKPPDKISFNELTTLLTHEFTHAYINDIHYEGVKIIEEMGIKNYQKYTPVWLNFERNVINCSLGYNFKPSILSEITPEIFNKAIGVRDQNEAKKGLLHILSKIEQNSAIKMPSDRVNMLKVLKYSAKQESLAYAAEAEAHRKLLNTDKPLSNDLRVRLYELISDFCNDEILKTVQNSQLPKQI